MVDDAGLDSNDDADDDDQINEAELEQENPETDNDSDCLDSEGEQPLLAAISDEVERDAMAEALAIIKAKRSFQQAKQTVRHMRKSRKLFGNKPKTGSSDRRKSPHPAHSAGGSKPSSSFRQSLTPRPSMKPYSEHKRPEGPSRTASPAASKPFCFRCQTSGHWMSECPKKQQQNKTNFADTHFAQILFQESVGTPTNSVDLMGK
jgi:hypothetical protein